MWPQTHSRLKSGAGALVLLLTLRGALAQPMMLDPSQMSGIPRPDPQVPTGTVTVRLIRGDLANRVVDAPVELSLQAAADQAPRVEKTSAEGRATFGGLSPAIYQARATVDGKTLSSQPIEVMPAPAPGIRVMLVFPKSLADQQKELGTPDGKARLSATAPAGDLLVKTVDAGGKPLPGLRVVLLRATRDSDKVETMAPKLSDADGSVSYSGLSTNSAEGYMISVLRDGSEQRSQPFQLSAEHGSVVALTIHNTTRDLGSLRIGQGSHAIFEPQDDMVQVMENLILVNGSPQPVDPGPTGLRIPLAEDALSAQVLPGGPAMLSIDASQSGAPAAVWKGAIPPGQTMLSVAFVLKQRGSLTFRQVTNLRVEGLRVGVAKLPELHVDGITDAEDRKLNGRDFLVASAIVPGPGGTIEFVLSGLPTDFYILRIIAAIAALAIALCFVYLTITGGASEGAELAAQKQHQKLMNRREALLDELLRAEETEERSAPAPAKTGGKQKLRDKAQIQAELEEVYRKLDESDGPETLGA
jgi:hypothetical protein